jgi:molybdopterin synthase sulfurtransferase
MRVKELTSGEPDQFLAQSANNLLDTRPIQAYNGWRLGDEARGGHIPGTIFGNCGSDAYHMENYCNFDHIMREYDEIAEKWIDFIWIFIRGQMNIRDV